MDRAPYDGPVIVLDNGGPLAAAQEAQIVQSHAISSYARGPTSAGGVNLHDTTFSVAG